MAENSKIEWTDHTFNPWTGCTKVSPGCDHCYAESWAKRSGHVKWGPEAQRRRTALSTWAMPLKWNSQAEAEGRRYRVFCASLADVFDNQVPFEWRFDLFRLIAATRFLDWLLLTKRVGNAHMMINQVLETMWARTHRAGPTRWPWPHVWVGATVVNQEEAERDIPKLLATPAHVRFLSIEPMLGPIDLEGLWGEKRVYRGDTVSGYLDWVPEIDWVICGGESGTAARPMHPDWARALRDQSRDAGVPFLFKQWGGWAPDDGTGGAADISRALLASQGEIVRIMPHELYRYGNKAAGRLLDGRTHDGFPELGDV